MPAGHPANPPTSGKGVGNPQNAWLLPNPKSAWLEGTNACLVLPLNTGILAVATLPSGKGDSLTQSLDIFLGWNTSFFFSYPPVLEQREVGKVLAIHSSHPHPKSRFPGSWVTPIIALGGKG